MILGIDGGNNEIKIVGPYGEMKFPSEVGEYREIMEESLKGDSIVFEYEGKKGFAGSLAKYESEFACAMSGDTKAHSETKLRVVLAIAVYTILNNDASYEVRWEQGRKFKIVVGQPVGNHKQAEKQFIKDMLIGEHSITINNIHRTFTIENVEVAPEGMASYFVKPESGMIRIIDIGSGTINFASVMNGRPIDKDSFTLDVGMNSTKQTDLPALARLCITKTSRKWKKKDRVYVVGGVAEYVLPYIEEYYKNAQTLYPVIRTKEEPYAIEPIYCNAYGFYELAKGSFENG